MKGETCFNSLLSCASLVAFFFFFSDEELCGIWRRQNENRNGGINGTISIDLGHKILGIIYFWGFARSTVFS